MELNRIYVLNVDSEINIAAYSPGDAFIELARHTYLNRYLNATDSTLENFRQCELVTKSVPVLRLNRPHDFNKLSEIPVLIEKDINSKQPH
jgi:hypothetical protein